MAEQKIQVDYLRVSADEKGFMEHKICFKQCIKKMDIPSLDANQTECVKNCLFKFNAVERLMIQKMRQIMQTYIASDPNLKKAITNKNKQESKSKQ